MRNINISISDELIVRMDELKTFHKINWSSIAKMGIEQYIKQRSIGSIEEKIKDKSEDFKLGYYFVIESIDNLDLKTIEDMAHNRNNKSVNRSEEFDKGMREVAKELLLRSEEN